MSVASNLLRIDLVARLVLLLLLLLYLILLLLYLVLLLLLDLQLSLSIDLLLNGDIIFRGCTFLFCLSENETRVDRTCPINILASIDVPKNPLVLRIAILPR
jgi:hypothetical protein